MLVIAPHLGAEEHAKSAVWPEISINLMALDHQNGVIQNLTPENVLVTENGQPQTITLSHESSPVSICIMMDVSSSMKTFADVERRIISRVMEQTNPQDEICLLSFAFKGMVEQRFTRDRLKLMAAANAVEFGGATAYLDSIEAAAKYMGQYASNDTRVLVMITDGGDNASDISAWKLAQGMKVAGSMLCVLGLVPNGDELVHKRIEETLHESVEASGGLIFYANGTKQMDAAADQMSEAIRGRYRLTYTSTNVDRNGKVRFLKVRPLKTSSSVQMIVHAPKGYYAPSQ